MDAVRAERDRRLDVVVDDERRCQVAEPAAAGDDLGGRRLHAQLDDRRAGLDRAPRRLEVLDDRVHPHVTFALASSVSGSSAASAS